MSTARARGVTLVEAIVAMTLGLVVALMTLGSFDAGRRLFQRGESEAERQQQCRQALDEILRTLRDAGAGADPDGDPSRPDESLEGAWDSCLIVRGDFDATDATGLAADPESVIGGAGSPVFTGNDEIIGWFLRPMSGTGGGTLRFEADVSSAATTLSPAYGLVSLRDRVVDPVDLAQVDTTGASPPYTLYRAALQNPASAWAGGSGISVLPVADYIRSLDFRYFDRAGASVPAPGGLQAAKPARASISRVDVTLVGVAPDPEPGYLDPFDPSPATRNRRKFTLNGSVFLESCGRAGAPDPAAPPRPVPSGIAF